ncbi:Putative ribonuclease H protein At1g65750 [Linum perenne]
MKSAYKLIMDHLTDRTSLIVTGQWNEVWKLQIPPKVKHFLWTLARGILSLRSNLNRRKIPVPIECGLCDAGVEDEFHMFLNCPKEKEVWNVAGLLETVESIPSSLRFADWLDEFWWRNAASVRCSGAMILWGLWGERNQLVWRHESRIEHLIVEGALTILDEWKMTRAIGEH